MFSKSEPLGNTLIAFGCLSLVVGLLSGISKSILEVWNEIEFRPKVFMAPPPSPEWLQAIGGLFAKPVVLAVYWLVKNRPFEVSQVWPVPGLRNGLDQVKADLGVA